MNLNDRQKKHIAKIIENHVAYFNGWSVPEETLQQDCKQATDKISKYLKKQKG